MKATSECWVTGSVVGWLPNREDVTFHISNMETWNNELAKIDIYINFSQIGNWSNMENFKNDILEASTTGTKDDEDTKETKSKNLTTYQQNRTRIFSQVTVLIKMLTFV